MTTDAWWRFETNDVIVHFKFNLKSLCIARTVGEVQSGMGHVLAPIASASQHELAPWFVTAVVRTQHISARSL